MTPAVRHGLIVLAVAGVVMLTNLGGPRLWDRDEPRNAGCAREMLARMDWIVPTFNAELRTHKPVLLYWCIMVSYSVFGIGEFSARLPSAMFAIGSALATYAMARRLFNAQAALWSAIALATSLMFGVAGRAATPDGALIFCGTLAAAVYVLGTFRPRGDGEEVTAPQLKTPGHYFPQQWGWVVALYAAMGLAVLAKGPVGIVLPTAAIGMFLLIMRLPVKTVVGQSTALPESEKSKSTALSPERQSERQSNVLSSESDKSGEKPKFDDEPSEAVFSRWLQWAAGYLRPFAPLHFLATCWYMRPLTAIVVAAAVAAPWYIAVGMQTEGKFIEGFFLEHNLERATQSFEGHRGSIFFYPLVVLVGFFPWSVFAVPLLIDLVQRLRARDAWSPGYILAACWVAVYVGVFTIARTKLPSYITPCYPGLALLAGAFVFHWSRQTTTETARWWLPVSFGSLAVVGLALLIALPFVAQKYMPGESWLAFIGGVPLAAGVVCLGLWYRKQSREATFVFAAAAVAFPTLILALGAQRADAHQTNHVLLQAVKEQSQAPEVACYRILEPSWVFYGGWPIRELRPPSADSSPARHKEGGKLVHVAKASPQAQAMLFFGDGGDRFLITTRRALKDLENTLPEGVEVIAETELFLKGEQLVLLGRPKPGTRLADQAAASSQRK